MSNFPTPLEEVIHHNVIKNNKTGGPVLDIGPMQLLWRALGENTGYTFSIYETTVVPGMGIPLHKHPFAEFFYVLEGTLAIGSWHSSSQTRLSMGHFLSSPLNSRETATGKQPVCASGRDRINHL